MDIKLFDTGVKVPTLINIWQRAGARAKAEDVAYRHLINNDKKYKSNGINKPAAALCIENGEFKFFIYDDDINQNLDEQYPNMRIIKNVNPYYLPE